MAIPPLKGDEAAKQSDVCAGHHNMVRFRRRTSKVQSKTTNHLKDFYPRDAVEALRITVEISPHQSGIVANCFAKMIEILRRWLGATSGMLIANSPLKQAQKQKIGEQKNPETEPHSYATRQTRGLR